MRNRLFGRIALMLLGGLAGALTLSLTRGQPPAPRDLPANLPAIDVKMPPDQGGPPLVRPVSGKTDPIVPKVAAPQPKARAAVAYDRFRNLDALPDLTRQMVMSGLTGMEWLHRYNQPNGLFLHGYLPAVNQPMEGDHYLHQATATFVLARAARFLGDERFAVRANQAILTLLSGTSVDPTTPGVRRPAQPSIVCNRLAAAGFVLMAIGELPEPAADMIAKAEELSAFIRQQQREDGSLSYTDAPGDTPDPAGINLYPGPAFYGLALSQRMRPAAWKVESLRKAVTFYRKWFHDHPHADLVPWMTAACTESYATTKDSAFAEFALEMTDWLCRLQYAESPDPRRPLWRGGFKNSAKDAADAPPGIEAALYAQSLADACRLIRQMPSPDLQRYDQYRMALLRSLQFLITLQFTDANTLHISANYRHLLVGGFHPTHADGNLRVDQSAAAISAMIQFLVSGADRTQ